MDDGLQALGHHLEKQSLALVRLHPESDACHLMVVRAADARSVGNLLVAAAVKAVAWVA